MEEKTKMEANKYGSLKWGILGTGRIALEKMINAFHKSPNNYCYAIASRKLKRAKRVSMTYCIPKFYDNYYDLIDDPEINAVYIPLPNSMHYEWVIKTAKKRKHILCEKPIALSLKQIVEMIKVCRENGVILYEAFSYFLHPQFNLLLNLLDNQLIGNIKHIYFHFSYPAIKEISKYNIRFSKELGGGSFYDIGCYGIDFINRILNDKIKPIHSNYTLFNKVDSEFFCVLKSSNNDCEVIVISSLIQERKQTLLISGENGNIFLPYAFVPKVTNIPIFVNSFSQSWIEYIDNENQYELLVNDFYKSVKNIKLFESNYDRYLRNSRLIDNCLKIKK